MSWWFSFKNIYGLIMGTSTDWMKPIRRPHWPTTLHKVDDNLSVFLGGSGNCGILSGPDGKLLINCNSGKSSEVLLKPLVDQGQKCTLVATSLFPESIGGFQLMSWERVYGSGNIESAFNRSLSSETSYVSVKDPQKFHWGDETVHLIPVSSGFSKNDLMVYLEKRKMLFSGGLIYNKIHPSLPRSKNINLEGWVEALKNLMRQEPFTQVQWVVPQEGDIDSQVIIKTMIQYLQSLGSHEVEFSYCREHFDWSEIPGHSSLEENFDHLRNLNK